MLKRLLLITLCFCGIGYAKPVKLRFVAVKGQERTYRLFPARRFPLSIFLRNGALPQIGNPSTPNTFFFNGPFSNTGVQAGITALGSGTMYIPPSVIPIGTVLTTPNGGLNIICSGVGTTFQITGTNDFLDPSAGNGSVSNCNFSITSAASRATACLFNASTSSGSTWTFSNLTFNGNSGSPNNGKTFCMNVSGVGIWNILNPLWIAGGGTWQSGFEAKGTASTVTSINIVNPIIGRTLTCNDACLIFDTFVDTAYIFGGQIAPTAGNAINVRNTGASTAPSWVHFNDTRGECGGSASAFAVVKIDDGRDIEFSGYAASCQNAFLLNGGTRLNIHDTSITSIGQTCIVQTATPVTVKVHDNLLEDCGITTTNTFPYVSITSGATGLDYHNNQFRQVSANKATFVFSSTGAITNASFNYNDASQPVMGTGYNNLSGTLNFYGNLPAVNFPDNTQNAYTTSGTVTATAGLKSSTFANLPAAANGTVYGCSDCTTASNPCTGASTGAVAVRQNGVWVCK